ncbi:MAG TPA: GDSL-type esterase/lipase family protein [Candidatus Dormibacteraeota bacterium]|jgi:lysophospholipase L1-like esterase|nr:GDSL-type esterase/lipase family protein [Candidatus Dormibacteraeota bacterium]
MPIRRALVVPVALALLLTTLSNAAAAQGYPNSMAATGDSITRAFNTGFFWFTDAPQNSWSTGTNATVNSHYLRLRALHPGITGKNYNDARSGAKMAELAGQMSVVVAQKADYVTVLMGGNDLCASSVSAMTPVADFAQQFDAAMSALTAGLPHTRVFVASIPNAYHLWEILHDDPAAQLTWTIFRICQALLANPDSTAPEDQARREAVRQRNIEYNSALASICAAYLQCRFDQGAVFDYPFTTADVSTRDYFHPSLVGQTHLAAVTWSASYWGP